ncbi:katanin p80 WD40 repeat-containing subunit B1-like [Parambassis ranga]|uniref:Katanin p80 WD40 repeat-containing subunit B1-like n=1 Tax=Parambassis ranga TaxID=210632 RepID=A0A6P7ICE8_9TELE|nr:katanin p80 WD40 repeat-containing subunit B1-like [Parambassis ranga]
MAAQAAPVSPGGRSLTTTTVLLMSPRVSALQSGSIPVWDLEAGKILRTLMGHKASITSLAFHPSGDLLASSSMDTNIKLWDIRRKESVFRYKGHTQAVRSLAFSPDGKWLASASDDCTVKLWDLTQGKTITEFRSHTAAVNTVQFHPNEYLLASGSSDRTIKLWDLEKFTMISSLEGDTTPVRSTLFSLDGSCLYSGATDSLRVFGWEPDRCFDAVPVGWGRVSDLALCGQQLIGVSHQLSSVSSYVVDLERVKKSGGSVIQGIPQDSQDSRAVDLSDEEAGQFREDIKRALDKAVSMNDLSFVVDILNMINPEPSLWRLDLCMTVLPQIDKLLQSKYESYIQTGCTSLELIMKHFWLQISDALKAAPPVGVDITRERMCRRLQCHACCKQLKNLSSIVKKKDGRHDSTFKELQLLMAPLDEWP